MLLEKEIFRFVPPFPIGGGGMGSSGRPHPTPSPKDLLDKIVKDY